MDEDSGMSFEPAPSAFEVFQQASQAQEPAPTYDPSRKML